MNKNDIRLFKCPWHEIFYYVIRKRFQNDEDWRLFYCDGTLGCRVIQDFDLCKLHDLWRHNVDKMMLNHKKWNLSEDFFCMELKLCIVVTLIPKFHDMSIVAFPGQHNGLQALPIQKVKLDFSSFRKCYLLLLFIKWVWGNMEKNNKQQKVR